MADDGVPQEVTIDQLLAAQPYNPELIPDLEAHVDLQVSSGSYHLDANLALLRLYQFEPSRLNVPKVCRILIKAMMQLPRVDCSLCLGLVPEPVQLQEPVATIASLLNFLESTHFAEFWTEANKQKDILAGVPGFDEAIQAYALHVLGLTYKRVPREVLAEAVNVNGPSLDDYIKAGVEKRGWFVSKTKNGEVVELGSPGADPFLHKAVEAIPVDHVARLFPMLS